MKKQNLLCFQCGNEHFAVRDAKIPQEYRGLTLEVTIPASHCTRCGWVTLADGQLDALSAATRAAYNERINQLNTRDHKLATEPPP